MRRAYIGAGILVFAVISACVSTSTLVYRHPEFATGQFHRVAVFQFEDATGHAGSGKTVASIFEATLLASGRFEVVERGQIDRVLEERHPSPAGEFENVVALGKLLRADIVIVGQVTNWHQAPWGGSPPSTVGASIKAVGVERGVVLWSLDKSTSATFWTDGIPISSPPDIVARKLCREMVQAFVAD